MTNLKILSLSNLIFEKESHGFDFESKVSKVGITLGSKKLGYSIDKIPSGKKDCPYHFHYINEEMFFIIEGEGIIRCAEKNYNIKSGDIISIPPGPSLPHQIINNSNNELIYLSVSTMETPDVIEYPDSNKYAFFVNKAPGGVENENSFCFIADKDTCIDYWKGE